MSVDIRLEEHTVPKETPHGTVQRSLNQHKVYILNDETGKYTHCGFVGVHAFLPLAGFPRELLEDVTEECKKQLGRELFAGKPPLSARQLQEKIDSQIANDEESEFDDE